MRRLSVIIVAGCIVAALVHHFGISSSFITPETIIQLITVYSAGFVCGATMALVLSYGSDLIQICSDLLRPAKQEHLAQ